ncbi:MAG: hypothetical protein IT359_13105 [Gemmatimonadaceae bacterium]|nr:hypothetical protein [Gemmatimonadaceae bacterium]
MTKRVAIAMTATSTACIALAYGSAFLAGGARWGVWCMVVGLALMVVSMMALGVSRRTGGVGRLAIPLAFTFVVIVAGFAAALLLPADAPGERIILGLPLRAAIVVYGVGLLPLLVLPLAYALTFEVMTLREDDLARVRAMRSARALREAHAEPQGRTDD